MALATGLKINGVDMPSPLPYEISFESLDGNAGRSMDGKMKRDWVAEKRTISLTWGMLTESEARTILSAVNPANGHSFFQATVHSPEEGEYTGTFYAGSRKAPIRLKTNSDTLYSGLSFNIIER